MLSENRLSVNSKLVNSITRTSNISKTAARDFNKRKETSEKLFKCYICGRSLPSYSEVVAHLKLIHNACASRDCSKISDFKMHSSVCANRDFGCAICNKKFSDKFLLLVHFNEHIDAAFYACDICRNGFQLRKDLQRHLYHIHGKNASVPITPAHSKAVYQKCNNCLKYFRLFAEFEEHVSCCNTTTAIYACNICQVIFPTIYILDEHKLAEHKLGYASKGYTALKQGKRYFCGVCYLGFFKGDILQKHLMTHKMKMVYVCDVCYEDFICDNDLQLHYLQHIEEHYVLYDLISQYSCRSCMKTFKTQQELKDHLVFKNCTINNNKDCLNFVVDGKVKKPASNHRQNAFTEKTVENNCTSQVDLDISFDTLETHIYALKSGEKLLNCDDLECIIIMDFTSLFVLQRGVCASENRMPDVSNSEAYSENDIVDASILQNHMLRILSSNYGTDSHGAVETFNLHNAESLYIEQNSNTVAEIIETVDLKVDKSNNDSLKLNVVESNESPLGNKVSVDSINGNESFEFLSCSTETESFITNGEGSLVDDLISQTNVSCINQANSKAPDKENLVDYYNESSIGDLFICNICKHVFSSKMSLSVHAQRYHTGLDCHHCGTSFKSDIELKNHDKLFHQAL